MNNVQTAAQHTPGPEAWDWAEICRRQRLIAESSIGDDRAYEFECLAVMEKRRDEEAAKAEGSAS